jgi:hypothetical protein
MQLTVTAEHPVAGKHKRHGIRGLGAANGACGTRLAELAGNCGVCGGTTICSSIGRLEGTTLKIGQNFPIDGKLKSQALTIQIFTELLAGRHLAGRQALELTAAPGALEQAAQPIKKFYLATIKFNGYQPLWTGGSPQRAYRRVF